MVPGERESPEPANDRDSEVCVGEQACSHAGFGTRPSRNLRTLSTNSAGVSFRASCRGDRLKIALDLVGMGVDRGDGGFHFLASQTKSAVPLACHLEQSVPAGPGSRRPGGTSLSPDPQSFLREYCEFPRQFRTVCVQHRHDQGRLLFRRQPFQSQQNNPRV